MAAAIVVALCLTSQPSVASEPSIKIMKVPPPAFQKIKLVNESGDKNATFTISLLVGWDKSAGNMNDTYDAGEHEVALGLPATVPFTGATSWDKKLVIENMYRIVVSVTIRRADNTGSQTLSRTLTHRQESSGGKMHAYGTFSYVIKKIGTEYFLVEAATHGTESHADQLHVDMQKFP